MQPMRGWQRRLTRHPAGCCDLAGNVQRRIIRLVLRASELAQSVGISNLLQLGRPERAHSVRGLILRCPPVATGGGLWQNSGLAA